jgi:hypothetical protein
LQNRQNRIPSINWIARFYRTQLLVTWWHRCNHSWQMSSSTSTCNNTEIPRYCGHFDWNQTASPGVLWAETISTSVSIPEILWGCWLHLAWLACQNASSVAIFAFI